MTAINHAITGAIIGAAVSVPAIALPVAFLSHYALDALPHFGPNKDPTFLSTTTFRNMLIIDALLCVGLAAGIFLIHPTHWWLLIICAFLGTAPDLFWINRYRYEIKGWSEQWRPGWHSRVASKIQWFEKPIGGVVEAAWLAGGLIILGSLLTV